MLRSVRYFTLPRQIRILLLQAALVVLAVRVGLWLLPSRWVVQSLKQPKPRSSRGSASVAQIVRSVGAVSKRVPRATCLTQAIAAQVLLAHYGYSPIIKVGAARTEGPGWRAHAWVEVDGYPVIGVGPDLREYSEFLDLQDALN